MSEAVADAPARPDGVALEGSVPTPNADRYLQQLCRHFAHKRPVSLDEHRGHIGFTAGECRLEADNGELRMTLRAPGVGEMAQLMEVMQRHLVRFAFREDLSVQWRGTER